MITTIELFALTTSVSCSLHSWVTPEEAFQELHPARPASGVQIYNTQMYTEGLQSLWPHPRSHQTQPLQVLHAKHLFLLKYAGGIENFTHKTILDMGIDQDFCNFYHFSLKSPLKFC